MTAASTPVRAANVNRRSTTDFLTVSRQSGRAAAHQTAFMFTVRSPSLANKRGDEIERRVANVHKNAVSSQKVNHVNRAQKKRRATKLIGKNFDLVLHERGLAI